MKKFKPLIGLVLITTTLFSLSGCHSVRIHNVEKWGKFFKDKGINEACFELYDNNKEIVLYYNHKRITKQMPPGGIFDIFSSIAGLSENIALSVHSKLSIVDTANNTIDSVSLKQAFRQGNTAYFRKLVTLIGKQRMQVLLDTLQYGNKTIGADSADFFNDGSLKISPDEVVGIIQLLYNAKMPPFGQRSIRLVQQLMLQERHKRDKLYYRYASVPVKDSTLHWLAGYLVHTERLRSSKTHKMESILHTYFFTMNFATADNNPKWKGISVHILKEIMKANHSYEAH